MFHQCLNPNPAQKALNPDSNPNQDSDSHITGWDDSIGDALIINGLMGLDNYKNIIIQARHAQTEDTDRTIHNSTLPILSIINLWL